MILPTASLMHPTLVARPVQHAVWVYEEKVDGYRMLAYKEGQSIRLVSRRGTDFTRRFPGIVAALRRLDPPTLILDGEVAIYDPPPSAGSAELDLMMDRRTFLGTLAGGLLAAPLAAQAQQVGGRIYRIGVFHVGDHIPSDLQSLRDGLKNLGYEEGRNIHLDVRNLADEEAASRTASEFVRSRVDLIVALGNPPARAARAATAETPIVMLHVTDPVAQGLVKTLARPAGNVTGFVFFAVSPAKQVELFKEILPGLRRVLVLIDPRDPTTPGQLAEIREAAGTLKLTLVERKAANQADLAQIFGSITQRDVDGVVSASINLQIKFTALLIRLTADKRVPLATYRKESVQEGALFSYAPDIAAIGRRAATLIDRILKGAKPGDLPVEQPTKFELIINLKTAKALGLTIPPSLLQRADQVIE